MDFSGIIIGIVTFGIIGIFHPIVIKAEYYCGTKIWPLFLAAGIACMIASVFIHNVIFSGCSAVLGCTCFWSIRELYEQKARVEKGWFPANPAKIRSQEQK